MTSIKRHAAAASAAVLLVFSLAACGDDDGDGGGGGGNAADAPTDASTEDFCEAFNSTSDLGADASSEEQVDEAHKQADKVTDVGTPEDISDDEREGFEIFVDAVQELDADDVEKFTGAGSEDEFKDALGASDDDYEKITAFLTYAGTTCAEVPPAE